MDVIVHKRIMERHPELTEQDVLDAWDNAFTYAARTHCAHPFETMALGYDGKSRLIEMRNLNDLPMSGKTTRGKASSSTFLLAVLLIQIRN